MADAVTRDWVKEAFRPISSFLMQAAEDAQRIASFRAVATANPSVNRESHIHRVAGTLRWMLTAEGLVGFSGAMPGGYGVWSTDADHNGGRYVFRWPGGVFTIKRTPHEEDEGFYLQERLDLVAAGLKEASGGSPTDVTVYLSVPPQRCPKLIVTHSTLSEPFTIALDELLEEEPVALPNARPRSKVRSSRVETESGEEAPETTPQQ
jgi:hypothetical protein